MNYKKIINIIGFTILHINFAALPFENIEYIKAGLKDL